MLLALVLAAAVHAAPACPPGASTTTTIPQPFNNVTSAGDSLLIVKTGTVAVPTLNTYGGAASAPEFIPGEGDPTVTASFSLPAGSCSELLLPPGFPLLQVFADGGARIGFGVNATSFAIKANGGGTVYTDEALELDYLYAFTDGPGRINLTNSDNLIESLALFANGASSQFIAGTVDKVEVQQMNGMTKVYVEEVLSNINLVLADGQSSLASKGSSTLTVTGKMNGVSKVTVAAGKCQTANSGASSCTTGPVDVAAFSV